LCDLIAHETVDILQGAGEGSVNTAMAMRAGLVVFAAANGLVSSVNDHLAWIDRELRLAKQPDPAAADGQHLLEPDRSMAVPKAAQMDIVWGLFQAAVQAERFRERKALLELAQTLTGMCGLNGALLETAMEDTQIYEQLHAELDEVRQALHGGEPAPQSCP